MVFSYCSFVFIRAGRMSTLNARSDSLGPRVGAMPCAIRPSGPVLSILYECGICLVHCLELHTETFPRLSAQTISEYPHQLSEASLRIFRLTLQILDCFSGRHSKQRYTVSPRDRTIPGYFVSPNQDFVSGPLLIHALDDRAHLIKRVHRSGVVAAGKIVNVPFAGVSPRSGGTSRGSRA